MGMHMVLISHTHALGDELMCVEEASILLHGLEAFHSAVRDHRRATHCYRHEKV
jgi:hypothetical protein